MNKHVEKVLEAWPILAVVGVMMLALLTAYAKVFVGDVVRDDLATTPTIIEIDKLITKNSSDIEDHDDGHDDDVDRLAAQITGLEKKIDRLIEIMLTDE